MTARTPVEFVTLQGQRAGNQVQIVGGGGAAGSSVNLVDAAGTDIDTVNPLPAEFYRGTTAATASFAAATDSSFIDKRRFAMVEIGPIPAAANGRNISILSATNAAGAGKAIPKYHKSDGTYAVFESILAVATGDVITIQADAATIHYIGFRVSGAAITADLPVRLTA